MSGRQASAREPRESAVSVLVVDDSPAYLGALRDVVGASAGFELVGEARSGEEAIRLAAVTKPDLVLMDVRLPGIGGMEAGARISESRPGTVILLLSSIDEEAMPTRSADVAAATIDKRRLSPRVLAKLWSASGPGVR